MRQPWYSCKGCWKDAWGHSVFCEPTHRQTPLPELSATNVHFGRAFECSQREFRSKPGSLAARCTDGRSARGPQLWREHLRLLRTVVFTACAQVSCSRLLGFGAFVWRCSDAEGSSLASCVGRAL